MVRSRPPLERPGEPNQKFQALRPLSSLLPQLGFSLNPLALLFATLPFTTRCLCYAAQFADCPAIVCGADMRVSLRGGGARAVSSRPAIP